MAIRYHEIRKTFLFVRYNIDLKTLLQPGVSEIIFYRDLVYKFNSKILSNVIKRLDIAWMSCDNLQAWILTQSRFRAMAPPLLSKRWLRP